MYLKNGLITFLKVKNTLFIIIGFIFIFIALFCFFIMNETYGSATYSVSGMYDTLFSVLFSVSGAILLAAAGISRKLIRDAVFCSEYFETTPDGFAGYLDLAEVMGKSARGLRRELRFLRPTYMKGFSFSVLNGVERIQLDSKTSVCECRGCGALLKSRDYFAGRCPYCGRSDIYAKVIAGDRFYSISQSSPAGGARGRYVSLLLPIRIAWYILAFSVVAAFAFVLIAYIAEQIEHYNDYDYISNLILSGNGYSSYEAIRNSLRDNTIFGILLDLMFWVSSLFMLSRLRGLVTALRISRALKTNTSTYITAPDLRRIMGGANETACFKALRRSLRMGYLKNCAIENRRGSLCLSLKKKIVKDICPYCAAPISGRPDINYACSYCGRRILGVTQRAF